MLEELVHAMGPNQIFRGLHGSSPRRCPNWFLYYFALLVILNSCALPGVTANDVHACMYAGQTNAWFAYDREPVLTKWADALCRSGLLRPDTPFSTLRGLVQLLDHGLTACTGLPKPVKALYQVLHWLARGVVQGEVARGLVMVRTGG